MSWGLVQLAALEYHIHMGLPGKKLSKRSKRTRAAHSALKPAILGVCSKCKSPVKSHTVCMVCGTYRGRQVLKIASALDKKKKS